MRQVAKIEQEEERDRFGSGDAANTGWRSGEECVLYPQTSRFPWEAHQQARHDHLVARAGKGTAA
jgi:hypothetical protein